jgi:hypothetical protein
MAEWNSHAGDDLTLLNGNVMQLGNSIAPIRQTWDRREAHTDVAAALTTQVMLSTPIVLRAGDVITNIAVQFGHTAAVSPTNWWFALYSNAATPALLAQTADQTTGAIAADAFKDLPLTAAQTISADGVYWIGIMVKAGTVPSLPCQAGFATSKLSSALLTGMTVLAQTSGASLTTTAPATIATPTAVVNVPYAIAH